jgi:hypothetical protein
MGMTASFTKRDRFSIARLFYRSIAAWVFNNAIILSQGAQQTNRHKKLNDVPDTKLLLCLAIATVKTN